MKYFIGIDDAGRGPIIGPLVLAGILANEKQVQMLKQLEVKDSKQLTPRKREYLAKRIEKFVTSFYIVKIFPNEIDSKLNGGTNLNKVEAHMSAEIINFLTKKLVSIGISEVEIILDCPSPNITSWKNYLYRYIADKDKVNYLLRCEHKADVNHAIVSAASILAKVARDSEVEKIKLKYGIDCGSGYPSDPLCKKFLKEHGDEYAKLGIVRKTWATWHNHVNKRQQKKLSEF